MRTAAYLRTSSASNIEGDSPYRQTDAIMSGAPRINGGLDVVMSVWDAAISGVDPIESRPGFSGLLDLAGREGIEAVIVESPDRFARDLIAQELGIRALLKRGIRLYTASGQELTDQSDPGRIMVRQVFGSLVEYDKAKTVARLKAGRDRKRAAGGYCGGFRPTLPQAHAKAAREAAKPGVSLRAVSAALASQGILSASGRPYEPSTVKRLIRRGAA